MNNARLKDLLAYALPYRATLTLGAVLMLVESIVTLWVPWLGGRLAEGLLAGSNAARLALPVLLGLLGVFALQALLKYASSFLLSRSAERILADLRLRVYDHLQALPLTFYQQQRRGEILALLAYDVPRLSGFLSGTLLSVIPLAIMLAGSVLLMFRIDARLAAVVMVLIPLFYLLLKVLGRRLRPLAVELQQAHAGAIAVAEESLDMLPAIKAFTRESRESARYRQQVDRILRLSTEERRIAAALSPALQFLAAAGIVLVLWLMSEQMQDRSPAGMVSFLLYAGLLTRPVSALADLYGQARQAHGALARLQQVLTEPREPLAHAGQALPVVCGDIEFRDVSFAYPGRPPVLQRFNLQVRAGETVAITGANGSGKSTLVHLLMRLHEPASGQIRIDGTDIAGVSLASLRG